MDAQRDIRDIVQGLRQVAQVAEQEAPRERRRASRSARPLPQPSLRQSRSVGSKVRQGGWGRWSAGVAALVLAALGWGLWAAARTDTPITVSDPTPASPATSASAAGAAGLVDAGATVAPEQWVRVVGELDRRRVDALRRLDPTRLLDYAVAGSAVLRRDRATIEEMKALGVRPLLRANRLLAVQEVSVGLGEGSTAVLRVVDRRPGFAIVDTAGTVARRVPFRGQQAWEVRIRAMPGQGWRVASVRALSDASATSAQGGSNGAGVGVVEAEAGVEQPSR